MKIRIKAVFGNPKTELAAKAIDGLVYGEWTDVVTDEDYDIAADKFLSDHPECRSWNISVEEQKGENESEVL